MEHLILPFTSEQKIGSGAVLVLAPHPDDEIFGCGGAIIKHVRAGDPVHVIIITDGGFILSDDHDPETYAETRKQESLRAGEMIGYKPEFWELEDRNIEYGEKFISRISEVLSNLDIDLLYAPSVMEMHPDHRTVGMAAAEATRRSRKNIKLAFYEISFPLHPNLLLDITDSLELKKKAVNCFTSQLRQQNYEIHVEALNRYRTYTLPPEVKAAEAYFVTGSEELAANPSAPYRSENSIVKLPGLDIRAADAPRVSVIVRSMGRTELLSCALESIALQTYPAIEVVVVNALGAGHPDLDRWCGRFPMRLCGTGKPMPRSRAANFGLDNAQGTFIVFLDDDDLFAPDHIATLVEEIRKNPGALAAYTGVATLFQQTGEAGKPFNQDFDPLYLLASNYIPIHSVMFHRKLLDLGCRFDEDIDLYEDWDFWLQVAEKTPLIHIDKITATYRLLPHGSDIQHDTAHTRNARLKIYKKWKERWKDEQLAELMQQIYQKRALEQAIKDKKAELAAASESIATLQQIVEARDETIQNLYGRIGHKKQKIEALKMHVSALEENIDSLGQTIANLEETLAEKNAVIEKINGELEQQRELSRQLSMSLEQENSAKNALAESLSARETEISHLRRRIQDLENEIDQILRSKSWKLTAVFRALRRLITSPGSSMQSGSLSTISQKLWHGLPVKTAYKLRLKEYLFSRLPFIFKHTRAYRNWQGTSVTKSNGNNADQARSLAEMLEHNPVQYVPQSASPPFQPKNIRLIAFYLPQFHPIPENDRWWGEGFTEWTNVKAARPQFTGHIQPREPGELGYYDLCEDPSVMKRQAELAYKHGIGGFCFYFYWFNGKRLLETPLLNWLENRDIDFPFCLCWANENWTRRWDGLDHELLIGQRHSPEDDIAFISHISKYLKDPRYIRIQGRPLLLVYRPGLLPSPLDTAKRWRKWCMENGIGEIHLAYTQSFDKVDPKNFGFDAAIEFPPNNTGVTPLSFRDEGLINEDFQGYIYDLAEIASRSSSYDTPDYVLYRGVCPCWDNTPRRGNRATIFLNDSPESYSEWLRNAARDTVSRLGAGERYPVFVNAWNEWAEGAYLEPDSSRGYAYLTATRDALEQAEAGEGKEKQILLVAHDAHPHGAQSLILHIAKMLRQEFSFHVHMVVLEGGPLLEEYQKHATIYSLEGGDPRGRKADTLASRLRDMDIEAAICNTTVTGLFCETLKKHGFRILALIHELNSVIENNSLQEHARAIARHADHVVFPAPQVKEGFFSFIESPPAKWSIRPQGLYKRNRLAWLPKDKCRKKLRQRLGIPGHAAVVLSVAYGDHRKGVDIFIESALKVLKKSPETFFVWVGKLDITLEKELHASIDASGHADRFIFPGLDFDTDLYYAGADLYALTSREDPFPSVVMEALEARTPVIAFAGTGGSSGLIDRGAGILVPAFDTDAYAEAVAGLLNQPGKRIEMGTRGREIVLREYSFRHYIFDLLELSGMPVTRISAIVPNYNYAGYLRDRIKSITSQTWPVYELIILDDASTDESIKIIENILPELDLDCTFIPAESNSGSPFRQWLRGVEEARGDFIWIAEADDLASPEFLEEVIKPFSHPDVVMSYCQSRQINSSGEVICNHYLDYVSDISRTKWLSSHISHGIEEIRTCLAVKNTIPNVSAVVFRKEVILDVLKNNIDEISSYRVAGDWLTYCMVLEKGRIAFSPRSLNSHRRHDDSVTIASFNISQLEEIMSVQKKIFETFDVTKETADMAHSYARHLYHQFGLPDNKAPDITDHPRLAGYLLKNA